MNSLMQDVRFGLRQAVRSSGFTAIIILTLALGIGANSAIFSVIRAVLLKPLSFAEPHRLVYVAERHEGERRAGGVISYANLNDLRNQSTALEDLAGFRAAAFTLSEGVPPEQVQGAIVTASFLSLLGAQPTLGRLFEEGEDQPGTENVALISAGCWQQRFGADPNILGRALTLDRLSFTVVGVLPEGFDFPIELRSPEIWTTTARDSTVYTNRATQRLRVVGRLEAGVSLGQARAELDTIAERLETQYPGANHDWSLEVVPLHDEVVGGVRPTLRLLFGAVLLVLLIACANVANLLLARGAGRGKEVAIRSALGAGRRRLIRQLLTESILLSLIGGVLGVMLAVWAAQGLAALLPENLPRRAGIAVDGPVVLFALALSVLTGLVFGLVPALQVARGDLYSPLKDSGWTSAGAQRKRVRHGLIIGQVAISLSLLIATGLLLRSLQMLLRVDPGFDPKDILTFQLAVPFPEYTDPPGRAQMYDEVRRHLANLPGVESVGATTTLPLHPRYGMLHIAIHGRGQEAVEDMPIVRFGVVSPDYFRTLGIPLRQGRGFTEHDTRDAPGALMINETMARQFWPNEDPLGARLTVGARLTDNEPESYEVVGIVGDVHDTTLDAGMEPYLYVPYQQLTWPSMCFVLRTQADPHELISAVRHEVVRVTRHEAPFAVNTLEDYVDRMIRPRRLLIILLSVFAGAAVVLTALGLYGVLAYAVAQRTREIGVRMALGAPQREVLRLVMYQGMSLSVIGLVLGFAAALGAGRLLSGMLFGITTADPATFVTAFVVLTAVTMLACYLPARRATKVDPMAALRYE